MTSSYLFVFLCLVVSIYAQHACPSIAVTQTLRTSWSANSVDFYLYDVTAVNNYDVAVSNIIFVASSLNVSQSWNLVQLPGSSSTPFTFVASGATSAVTIAPGQSWTGSGYVSEGAPSTIAALVTCTGPAASSSDSVATAASSSAPASSSAEAPLCSSQMQIGAELETSVAPSWNDSTYQYYEYTFQVVNTGVEIASSMNVAISYDTTFLAISQTWNMAIVDTLSYGVEFSVSLFALAPGQSANQMGIIFKTPLAGLATHHQGHYDFPYTFHTLSTSC